MKNGFTIIEITISIFVLSIAIIGIFNVLSIMVILTSDAADRLVATYLAQEGMEIVRNIRDTNWLRMDFCKTSTCSPSPTWDDGLDCEQGCEAYYKTGTGDTGEFPMYPWTNGGRKLKINTSGFYEYDVAEPDTKFKRKIIITQVEDVDHLSNHIIKVTVQVSWDKRATVLSVSYPAGDCQITGNCDPHNCIVSEATLYNWYPASVAP